MSSDKVLAVLLFFEVVCLFALTAGFCSLVEDAFRFGPRRHRRR